MAPGPPQPDIPVDDTGFREIVEWQVNVPLRDTLARTELSPDRFIREVLEKKEEILQETTPQR